MRATTSISVVQSILIWRGRVSDITLSFIWIHLGNARKISVEITDIPAEIRTYHLSHTKSRTLKLQRTARYETWCAWPSSNQWLANTFILRCQLILRTYFQVAEGHDWKSIEVKKNLNLYQLFSVGRYSDSLRAGRSKDRIQVGARFSAPVQTGTGDHPASYTMGTGSFLRVKRSGRGVDHLSPCSAEVKERVAQYLYSTSRPSWPVTGLVLPLPLPITLTEYASTLHIRQGTKSYIQLRLRAALSRRWSEELNIIRSGHGSIPRHRPRNSERKQ
jgi:hypothetical protein